MPKESTNKYHISKMESRVRIHSEHQNQNYESLSLSLSGNTLVVVGRPQVTPSIVMYTTLMDIMGKASQWELLGKSGQTQWFDHRQKQGGTWLRALLRKPTNAIHLTMTYPLSQYISI